MVASQKLICPFPGEYHFEARLAARFVQQIDGNAGGRALWLFQLTHDLGQQIERFRAKAEAVVLAANALGNKLGVSRFVVGGGIEGERDEYLRRLGETSHMFTDAGLILITTVSDLDDHELDMINTLNQPNDYLVINVGHNQFTRTKVDLQVDDLSDQAAQIQQIKELLQSRNYLIEYYL